MAHRRESLGRSGDTGVGPSSLARVVGRFRPGASSDADRRPEPRLDSLPTPAAIGAAQPVGDIFVSFVGGELRYLRRVGDRVVDWGHVPLPLGATSAGVVADAPSLATVLAETFGTPGRPRRRIVAALGARDARACLLSLPWVKERDLAAVVADDAPRALGVSTETHYLFWQRVAATREERRVYAVAVPREPLLATLEACEAGGVVVESLDLVPLALARAANQRDAVVVAVEPDAVEIVVVADDLPLLIRSAALAPTATPAEIAAEVARALAAYDDAFPDRALDPTAPVYLAGRIGGERAADLVGPLSARTGRRVGRPSPPIHLPADFPLAEQLVNVGLALKNA